LTTSVAELSMRHLSAGSARLLGTLALLLTMGVGVGIGNRCAVLLTRTVPAVPMESLPWVWDLLGILCMWLAFVVLLRASRPQVFWVLFAVGLAYGGTRLVQDLLGPELGAFLGALFVGCSANLFARWHRQPEAVVRTPGLLLLVPGSLGFRGLTMATMAVGGDATAISASVPFLLEMMFVSAAIVGGLLMSSVVVPPPLDFVPDQRPRSVVR
jgi:uncharacterized membrane protein YjjB (DUF3815 family)